MVIIYEGRKKTMYQITIKTKIPALKEIHYKVEDLDSPELKEILEQPYVDKSAEIRIEKIHIPTLESTLKLTLHK